MSFTFCRDFDWQEVFRKALARGGWLAEVFYEETETLTLQLEDRKLEKAVAGQDQGFGLRLLHGDKTAYAYSNRLEPGIILKMAGELAQAAASGGRAISQPLSFEDTPPAHRILRPAGSSSLKDKAGLVFRAEAAAWGQDARVRQVKVVYGERSQKVFLANSLGLMAEDARPSLLLMVQVVAEENGVIQTGHEAKGAARGLELFDEFPPEKIAQEAARRAVLMVQARPAPGGRMPVVLSSQAGGTMIHEAVGHGLEADLVLEGMSVYAGKLGQEVASPLVTVLDDATMCGQRGSFGRDDEGTPARRTVLIDQGRLTAYMTDRLYAKKGDLPLSGNGRRESFRHRPVVRMTNTYIAPGETPPEDILAATGQGLYVVKMGGGQVNTVNGDFLFEVSEGYLIDKGRIGRPVRGATLVGNGPAVLKGIDLVGSDLGFAIGTCGKEAQGAPVSDGQPTLRIPELLVGAAVA